VARGLHPFAPSAKPDGAVRGAGGVMMIRISNLSLLFATLFAAGCGENGAGPTINDSVLSVEVMPKTATLHPGETHGFTAIVRGSGNRILTNRQVSWAVDNPAVASIDDDGVVTAKAAGNAAVIASVDGRTGTAAVGVGTIPIANGDVRVDAGRQYQTSQGWEVTAWAGQWGGCGGLPPTTTAGFDAFKGEIIRRIVDEVGITRVRLEVRGGAENPRDWFADFRSGVITPEENRAHWYDVVNDNDDPFTIDPAGFHFSEMDVAIEQLVNPLRDRLAARGERLYVNLNLVQFGPNLLLRNAPDEYAEFMLAAFQHIQSRYGWVPDGIEVILEPDNGNRPQGGLWNGGHIGRAIVAAGNRLRAAGFNPDFIAPAVTNMSNATRYFDDIVQVAGAREFVRELSYHRYGSDWDEDVDDLQRIGDYAVQYGIRTAMLEKIGSGYLELHADLETGRDAAWSQYTMAGCDTEDRGGRHFLVDLASVASPVVTMASRTHFLRQYFLYVRPGAVRVDATSGIPALHPLAFINTNGKFAVVVRTDAAASFTIGGLPGGVYGTVYTTGPRQDAPTQSGVVGPDVTITTGQALPASIPARGVITIYAK
jgi:hypothetical protein